MKTLKKSENKVFAGVCGGIAAYFNIDAVIIRLIWVAVTLLWFFFPGLIIYIVAACIMPSSDGTSASGHENVDNLKSANVDENQSSSSNSSSSAAPHSDDDFNSYFKK